MSRPVAFSIAGSDPGGGAGIQQDIKVFTVLGVYGCAAITALTVQNTLGVQAVYPVPGDVLKEQVKAVMDDIRPGVIKIGMVSTRENVESIASVLEEHPDCFVVADPVLLSKNNRDLLQKDATSLYVSRLFPMVDLLTPNIPECELLSGISRQDPAFIEKSIERLMELMTVSRASGKNKPGLLLKGGHGPSESVCRDVLFSGGNYHLFESPRLANPHTHGTGCTLSSAVAAFIAKGESLLRAVEKARDFVHRAIDAGFALGKGIGPVDPLVFLK